MTPYELEVVLWYASGRVDDHPHVLENPPAWRPTIARFLEEQLLVEVLDRRGDHRAYALGPRGRVFAEALQSLPLPQAHWRMAWPANE